MKVRVLPCQPHCFAFGGFEIQMLDAISASRAQGIDIEPMNPWDQDGSFDVLHVWGFSLSHMPAVYWAQKSGKRVVMTALLTYPNLRRRIVHRMTVLAGAKRQEQKLLQLLDGIVVVNTKQKDSAHDIYGVPRSKIAVIPNIVSDIYFTRKATAPSPMPGQNYMLVTGNISTRKNQLALAKACAAENIPLLIIGDVLSGQESYGKQLDAVIAAYPSIHWQKKIQAGSAQLFSAYYYCMGFALPSHNETQPISLLEAGVLQKPLLVADKPYAHQEFYEHAVRVNPDSIESIRAGLRELWANPARHVPRLQLFESCRVSAVGTAYRQMYENLCALR